MLPADDPFAPLFHQTFDANYHPYIFESEFEAGNLDPLSNPLTFYDRHIGSRLVLKNIVYLPSIAHSLSKSCDCAIRKYLDDGHKFSAPLYTFNLGTERETIYSVHSTYMCYNMFVGDLAARYSYKLNLHPERESWFCPIKFEEKAIESGVYLSDNEAWLEVMAQYETLPILKEGLSEATDKRLQDLMHKYPRLASWHMFALTDTATGMLKTLMKNTSFKWETCRTQGCKVISTLTYPPDGPNVHDLMVIPKHSKLRGGSSMRHNSTATVRPNKYVKTPILRRQSKQYRPEFRHYIQHAWATAAKNDSTFMVFQCGRYERIGFRHRASQTLYLSGLIDTVNIKDPSYRKLHIGLHIAIIKDSLERMELSNSETKNSRKREVDEVDEVEVPSSKRTKADKVDKVDDSQVYDEIANRNLALVTLDYGAFCSPAPSSFYRIGPSCVPGHAVEKGWPTQTRYSTHECMSLILKEPLGEGAVGVVHPAVVTLTLKSGEVVKRNMAIKFAFTEEQQEKLFDEYGVYGHLSYEKGLKGIITVHGMFKDPESGIVGMLMNDAGQSLRRREIERGNDGRQVTTSHEERKAFRRVLKGLHEAGVRHHDIRADNLLINSHNAVFIADLDCADYQVTEESRENEMQCLNDLLKGTYQDFGYYTY